MGGWRSKFIFLLIVYFAGFATAIYCLASAADQNEMGQAGEEMFVESAFKSEQFAQSFNSKMHPVLDYAKEASRRMGRFIKQQIDERQKPEE